MTILQAVANGSDLKHAHERRESTRNFDARKADQDLRVCPKCDVVWEIMVFNQTKEYKYYHNFPKFGKKKGVCYSCVVRIKNKYYHNTEVVNPQ